MPLDAIVFSILLLLIVIQLLRAPVDTYWLPEQPEPRFFDWKEAAEIPLTTITNHIDRHTRTGDYYFWDRPQASLWGPYVTFGEARLALRAHENVNVYGVRVGRSSLRRRIVGWLCVHHKQHFAAGATRFVIKTRRFVFKVPTPVSYRQFLAGLQANLQEKDFSDAKWVQLCPVRASLPLGLLVVMDRAEPLTREEWEVFNYESFVDRGEYVIPAENKICSFGILRGRIVAVDYGS